MSGALVQIMATGAEDVSIMGAESDSRSFFQTRYKRHVPFSIQTLDLDIPRMEQVFGEGFRITIPRRGDMLSTLWLQLTMKKAGATYFPAEELIDTIQLYIGQQLITTCTGEWMRVKNELFQTSEEKAAYRRLTDYADGEGDGAIKTFWLPITFFLDVTPLPLISLQMHNVEMYFTFASSVAGIDSTYTPIVKVFADYVFLSNEERKYFAQKKQIMLVEQMRTEEDQVVLGPRSTTALKTRLYFRHPVKYIAWTNSPRTDFARFSTGVKGDTDESANPLISATITFDTHDRITTMPASYYNLVQPYTYLKASPCTGIHFFSFSYDPKDRKNPTGSANFSKISTAILTQTFKQVNANATTTDQLTTHEEMVSSGVNVDRCKIYAVNLNFLRIQNGLGALAYA